MFLYWPSLFVLIIVYILLATCDHHLQMYKFTDCGYMEFKRFFCKLKSKKKTTHTGRIYIITKVKLLFSVQVQRMLFTGFLLQQWQNILGHPRPSRGGKGGLGLQENLGATTVRKWDGVGIPPTSSMGSWAPSVEVSMVTVGQRG